MIGQLQLTIIISWTRRGSPRNGEYPADQKRIAASGARMRVARRYASEFYEENFNPFEILRFSKTDNKVC